MDRFVRRSAVVAANSLSSDPPPSMGLTAEPPCKRARVESENPRNSGKLLDVIDAGASAAQFTSRQDLLARSFEEQTDDYGTPFDRYEVAIDSSLPPVEDGDYESLENYENGKTSVARNDDQPELDATSRMEKRQWVRGRSSIYVDAFNLALQTVLEDEAHLFDWKERLVFERWKALSYEAQYLYVRLFLRKTAAWHRVDSLGYHGDISNPDKAIRDLLKTHACGGTGPTISFEQQEDGPDPRQDWFFADTFTFADHSNDFIRTMKEAVSLLSLDELKSVARDAKVYGKNKAELAKALCKMSSRQAGLLSFGLRRESTNGSSSDSVESPKENSDEAPSHRHDSNRNEHFLSKILTITGPLIRLSGPVFKLFQRVHLVFYRSTEWTEKSLTTIILAKASRLNFPEYVVCRSHNIFSSRSHLVEYEHALRKESEVDSILEFNGPPGEEGFRRVIGVFDSLCARWRELLVEEQRKEETVYEFGEGAYLRLFNPAQTYTRIAHKAAAAYGRLHDYPKEHELLTELLSQRLFHPARRGAWYQRKALLEENYMWQQTHVDSPAIAATYTDLHSIISNPNLEVRKRHWLRIAVATCEAGLQDRDCHLIYHYDLQKRLVRLERRLRIPKRLQHDFGHVRLRQPEEHSVYGIQLIREEDVSIGGNGLENGRGKNNQPRPGMPGGPSTRTVWLEQLDDGTSNEVSVEEMCLSWYRGRGWKGYHSEGGILRTLFAYLFFDVLFLYVPGVFQTAYQTCPLDLHTDAFFPARAAEIHRRLAEIGNGAAEELVRTVHSRESGRATCVAGLRWDYDVHDILELVRCFDGAALAAVCKVMAQEYGARGAGVPDLILWRPRKTESGEEETTRASTGTEPARIDSGSFRGEVMFVEVKSANDRLSDTQRLWIHVLTGAGIRVALCNAIAKEVRTSGK
ncbi:hypothetical protein VTK73DRAFT_9403 [Phialemonium thermophilum]|uniref:Fanconi-associated nuclease n=1 Tax=Phialemonium thermophilum TaxID=223376 RepID=A0ABR3XL58_9PEZI